MSADPFQAGGESLPSFKFANVGDELTGQIVGAKEVDDRDLEGELRTWPNGDPRKVWVFDLDLNADGQADASLWVRGNMFTVLRAALKEAEVATIGALIRLKHHALGEPAKKGYNAPKLFECKAKAGPALKPQVADPFSGDRDESF